MKAAQDEQIFLKMVVYLAHDIAGFHTLHSYSQSDLSQILS